MPNTIDDFVTVVAAASLSGRSYWTIRRWIDSGALTRYTSAGRVVVNRSQLLDLVRPRPAEALALIDDGIQQSATTERKDA